MKKRKAHLNPAEEKAWQFAFEYHLGISKQGQDRAAQRAWRDIQKEFPRLRKFAGAHP